MTEHEHQFPEEETPQGVRMLFPCLLCGLPALDALHLVKEEIAAVRAGYEQRMRLIQ